MSRFVQAVARVIARHGRPITYSVKGVSSYTPGGAVTQSSVVHTINAARVSDRVSMLQNGSFIIKDVTLFYLEKHDGVVFAPGDKITDAGEDFTVTKVEKHYAQGELVLYICYC